MTRKERTARQLLSDMGEPQTDATVRMVANEMERVRNEAIGDVCAELERRGMEIERYNLDDKPHAWAVKGGARVYPVGTNVDDDGCVFTQEPAP